MWVTVQCVLGSLVLSAYGCILFKDLKRTLEENDVCAGKGDSAWLCKKDTDCPGLQDILEKGKKLRTCSWKDARSHIICCPPTVILARTTISVSERKCSEYKNLTCNYGLLQMADFVSDGVAYKYGYNKVPQAPGSRYQGRQLSFAYTTGGVPSGAGEYPSTAIIGYGDVNPINWQCGGSLISERYVLSAAHCSNTSYGPARWVRLGDIDISWDGEDSWPQQFEIVERIVHSGYKAPAVYNDIVLFKLDQHAVFDKYVRPACLHQGLEDAQGKGTATGWGKNETNGPRSKILFKVDLKFIPTQECKKNMGTVRTYLPEGLDSETMICAGERGKDTCQGDSGGPLMLPKTDSCIDTQVGVTSFGSKYCGVSSLTSTYVRVAHFLPWIESVVWPDE